MADNEVMINYLQRLFGMSLSGCTREEILPIIYGLGQNGKSKFIEAITGLMGSYATEAAPDLLVERKSNEHSTEVAALFGYRLAIASEPKEGAELKLPLIKRLTGNGKVKARFMHKDFIECLRTFTICLQTNHKPLVPNSTLAEWRRLKLIPFAVTIPVEKRDNELADKLKKEWPGILNWLLAGCLEWQRNGLQEPDEVTYATNDYREEQDPIKDFFDSCCTIDPFGVVPVSTIKERYEKWCAENSIESHLSAQDFNAALRQKGCRNDQQWYDGKTQKVWTGLNLT